MVLFVVFNAVIAGASNVLTVAGIALGVAGSATTIGSKVTESVIEYKKKCELETHLRIDDSVGKQVDESLDEIHQEFESLKKLTSTTCARWAIMDWLTSLNRTRQFGQLSATTVSLVKKIIRLGSNGIGKAAVTSGDDILSNMVSLATRGALQGAKAGLAVGLGIASIGAIVDVVVMGYTIQQMRKGTESDSVKKLREIVRTLETSLEDFEYSYKDLLP